MPPRSVIPAELTTGPFTARRAHELGVSEKVLRGTRFRRLHPRVWALADRELSDADRVRAATLALPPHARLSHWSRLAAAGLQLAPTVPVHFTVPGDLHLALDGVMLHRTAAMPRCDDVGVSPGAALLQVAPRLRVLDLVAAADWLLHRELTTLEELAASVTREAWRPGAAEVRRVLPLMNGRARSLPESKVRLFLVAAGLPCPSPNVDLMDGDVLVACVDLLLAQWCVVLEYEGRQHAESIEQWNRDIGRYGDLRTWRWAYRQVTHEMMGRPRAMVLDVHRLLVEQGYTGPAPDFGPRWRALFARSSAPSPPWPGDLASTAVTSVDARSPLRRLGGR